MNLVNIALALAVLVVLALAAAGPTWSKGFFRDPLVCFLTGRDIHIDAPLSNIAIAAFGTGGYIGQRFFPVVPVGKQSNVYFKLDKAMWLRLPRTDLRAPGVAPARVEWKISSETYYCKNRALAGEIKDEDRANADDQVMLEQRTTRFVTSQLDRLRESRIASIVTSISNCGSGVALAAGSRWSNYTNSSPLSDVTTGAAFVRQTTGVRPNLMAMDWDTMMILRRHPELLDLYKYVEGGQITVAQLQEAFMVPEIVIADSVKNTATEGQAATMGNIWGNFCWMGYVDANPQGLETVSYGLGMRWIDPALGQPMAVKRYRDADEGKKTDVIDIQYYQDEKIVGQELSYLINTPV